MSLSLITLLITLTNLSKYTFFRTILISLQEKGI